MHLFNTMYMENVFVSLPLCRKQRIIVIKVQFTPQKSNVCKRGTHKILNEVIYINYLLMTYSVSLTSSYLGWLFDYLNVPRGRYLDDNPSMTLPQGYLFLVWKIIHQMGMRTIVKKTLKRATTAFWLTFSPNYVLFLCFSLSFTFLTNKNYFSLCLTTCICWCSSLNIISIFLLQQYYCSFSQSFFL